MSILSIDSSTTGVGVIKTLTVGSYIKSLRQAKKMTQSRLAELAGIDSGYLARIESDQREGSAEVIINIAKALELKPAHKIFAPLDPESLQEKTEHKGFAVYLPLYFTESDIDHIQTEIELLELQKLELESSQINVTELKDFFDYWQRLRHELDKPLSELKPDFVRELRQFLKKIIKTVRVRSSYSKATKVWDIQFVIDWVVNLA